MFALIAALTLYMALAPVQPALSVGDYRPHFSRQVHLTLAADRPDTIRQVPIKKDANRLGIETSAKAAIIIDWQTAQPLLEENADTPQPIASLTKLVTALVVLERGHVLAAVAMCACDLFERLNAARSNEGLRARLGHRRH